MRKSSFWGWRALLSMVVEKAEAALKKNGTDAVQRTGVGGGEQMTSDGDNKRHRGMLLSVLHEVQETTQRQDLEMDIRAVGHGHGGRQEEYHGAVWMERPRFGDQDNQSVASSVGEGK